MKKGKHSSRVTQGHLHLLALVRKQNATEGQTDQKYRNKRQTQGTVLLWRAGSPQLLVQKFSITFVHLMGHTAGNTLAAATRAEFSFAQKQCAAHSFNSSRRFSVPTDL